VDDSVESVDGVSGVFDGTSGTIRIDEGVASLDDISAAALDLALWSLQSNRPGRRIRTGTGMKGRTRRRPRS
jgi:hypothetical protein